MNTRSLLLYLLTALYGGAWVVGVSLSCAPTTATVECDSCKVAGADTVKVDTTTRCTPWPVCHDPKPPRFP